MTEAKFLNKITNEEVILSYDLNKLYDERIVDYKLSNFNVKRYNLFEINKDIKEEIYYIVYAILGRDSHWRCSRETRSDLRDYIENVCNHFKSFRIPISITYAIDSLFPTLSAPILSLSEFLDILSEEKSAQYLTKLTERYNLEHSSCQKAIELNKRINEDLETMKDDVLIVNNLSNSVMKEMAIECLKEEINKEQKKRKTIQNFEDLYQKDMLFISLLRMNDDIEIYLQNLIGNYNIKNSLIISLL